MRRLVWAGFVLIGVGCGAAGEPQVPIFPVKGTLYIDDKAFGPALLQLSPEPPDPKIPVVNGYVKQDGKFELQTYKPGDGAPAGTFNVVLSADPMAPGNFPTVRPATVSITKPSGSGPVQLDIKLQSSGEGMASPLPMPGFEGGRKPLIMPGTK